MHEHRFSSATGLPNGSSWIREAADKHCMAAEGLKVTTAPGSIWGDFGAKNPAINTLVMPTPSVTSSTSVQVTFYCDTRAHGEQGGLLLYVDDENWIKLVLEGMKGGSSAIVFAKSCNGSPTVVNKHATLPLPDDGIVTLRLTTTASGMVLAALVRYGKFGRGAAPTSDRVTPIGECSTLLGTMHTALMAHGGPDLHGAAVFEQIQWWNTTHEAQPIHFHYFDGRGLGEPIRYALGAAGVEYKECYLKTRKEFTDLLDAGKLQYGQVPLLEIDGLSLVQSATIARYVAKKYHLLGPSELSAQVDMLFDGARDFYGKMTSLPFNDDQESCRKELVETVLPKYFQYFEGLCAAHDGPFLVGTCVTIADTTLLLAVHNAQDIESTISDAYPNIKAWQAAMEAHKTVSTFLASPHKHRFPNDRYVYEVRVALGRIEAK